jgi:hypothetical protein
MTKLIALLRRLMWPCAHPDSGFRVAHTYCPGRENCTYCSSPQPHEGG